MTVPPFEPALTDYLKTLSELSPRSLSLLKRHYAPEARFKDPFFDHRGPEAILHAFERTFALLERPQYRFHGHGWVADGHTAHVRWTFLFYEKGKRREVPGMAEISFDLKGQVASHIDYWDAGAAVYERLPLLGWVIRQIKKKVTG